MRAGGERSAGEAPVFGERALPGDDLGRAPMLGCGNKREGALGSGLVTGGGIAAGLFFTVSWVTHYSSRKKSY